MISNWDKFYTEQYHNMQCLNIVNCLTAKRDIAALMANHCLLVLFFFPFFVLLFMYFCCFIQLTSTVHTRTPKVLHTVRSTIFFTAANFSPALLTLVAAASGSLGPCQSLRAHLAAERALTGAIRVRRVAVPLLFHALQDLVQNVAYREKLGFGTDRGGS